MSIKSQIDRIATNISNVYWMLEQIGITLPDVRNSDNLPQAVSELADTSSGKILDGSISGPYSNSKVTKLKNSAFAYCASVQSVSLPNCATLEYRCFYRATTLSEVNLRNVTAITGQGVFSVAGIESLYLPKLVTLSDASNMCNSCSRLTKAVFPALSGQTIPGTCFAYCSVLKTLVLGGSKLNPLSATNALTDTLIAKGGGYIYVPRDLVSSYKSATNWSTFANQIRAIEDYPEVLGG